MKNYFKFSKGQKIGVITVCVLLLIQLLYLNLKGSVLKTDPFVINKSDYELISPKKEKNQPSFKNKQTKKTYSNFNPNKLTVSEWQNLGFSVKQAESIIKYKNTIHGFKYKTDLKKVFVISSNKYNELEPYIKIIPDNKKMETNDVKDEKKEINITPTIEINSASKSDLMQIIGIGEFTAKGILKYKTKIGGYHSISQLKEVYGITAENYELIKPQLKIDKNRVNKILVNEWSIPKLKKHPYISWDIAQAITDKRLVGKLSSLQFLIDEKQLLNQTELDNLLPYIEY